LALPTLLTPRVVHCKTDVEGVQQTLSKAPIAADSNTGLYVALVVRASE
jgi:hypothetical protein